MDDYKVKYEKVDGSITVTEWLTKEEACQVFDKVKCEAVWVEMIYSPVDVPKLPDEELVVKEHTNKVLDILGHKILVPA